MWGLMSETCWGHSLSSPIGWQSRALNTHCCNQTSEHKINPCVFNQTCVILSHWVAFIGVFSVCWVKVTVAIISLCLENCLTQFETASLPLLLRTREGEIKSRWFHATRVTRHPQIKAAVPNPQFCCKCPENEAYQNRMSLLGPILPIKRIKSLLKGVMVVSCSCPAGCIHYDEWLDERHAGKLNELFFPFQIN